jgi:predicted ATPase
MITKLHLVNWKSFEDTTLYIDPLTFLIGTNASGKSNVLDAFLLLHLLMKGQSLEDAAAAIRGGEDWIIRKGQTWFELGVTIEQESRGTVPLIKSQGRSKGFFALQSEPLDLHIETQDARELLTNIQYIDTLEPCTFVPWHAKSICEI